MKEKDKGIDGVHLIDLIRHDDSRGWLMETFRSDELPVRITPAMSYLSVTAPGEARGPHEHEHQTDVFSFTGPGDFRLVLWDNRKASPTSGSRAEFTVGESRPVTVIVPPGVVHGYINVSNRPVTVINYPNQLYRGERRSGPVDEVRHEDDPDSKFKF